MKKKTILKIRNLRVIFKTYAGIVKAINGIDLDIIRGEILGIVGETGSGKSVTALSILRLIDPPGEIIDGEVLFKGINLLEQKEKYMRNIRGKEIAIIFQDPTTYLNPVYTIGDQIAEVIKEHQKPKSEKETKKLTVEILKTVIMPDPEMIINRYPHELSTGMRQRAMIAMMLSCHPEILIADESTTALDVTIQAQILHLLKKLKEKLGLTILFISHDLGVIGTICDRIAIMYAGNILELGTTVDVFDKKMHPYTRGLFRAIPDIDKDTSIALESIPGNLPNLINPPSGCSFYDRCYYKMPNCKSNKPSLKEVEKGHYLSCFNENGFRGVKT